MNLLEKQTSPQFWLLPSAFKNTYVLRMCSSQDPMTWVQTVPGVLCNLMHGMLFICIKLLLMLQISEVFVNASFYEKIVF